MACSLPIWNLFAHIENQSLKLSDAESELRDKKDVIKLARAQVKEAEKQIQALQLEKVRRTNSLFAPLGTDFSQARLVFASVLIDGDCMPVSYRFLTFNGEPS